MNKRVKKLQQKQRKAVITRLRPELYDRLNARAEAERRSMGAQVAHMLEESLQQAAGT